MGEIDHEVSSSLRRGARWKGRMKESRVLSTSDLEEEVRVLAQNLLCTGNTVRPLAFREAAVHQEGGRVTEKVNQGLTHW